tara:strand:+ start:21733 stop:22164 length:432 start_codon:yes stop_codon:yes gene_type:complete
MSISQANYEAVASAFDDDSLFNAVSVTMDKNYYMLVIEAVLKSESDLRRSDQWGILILDAIADASRGAAHDLSASMLDYWTVELSLNYWIDLLNLLFDVDRKVGRQRFACENYRYLCEVIDELCREISLAVLGNEDWKPFNGK